MTDGFEVIVEALHGHARSLGAVSDVLKDASQAASQPMPAEAFGVLGEAFPAMLRPLVTKGRETLVVAVASADQMTEEITQTAEEYQSMDDGSADSLDGIHDD